MFNEETADDRIERVIGEYRDFINPGLAKVMQFAGFADIEDTACGSIVSTVGGTDYLDFLGGYGVFSLGHRHPKVVDAVKRQLDKMPLSTRNFFNEQQGALAAELARLSPSDLQYTFFSNSGAEAVEAALKFAVAATGRAEFVSTHGAYHGKTIGALAVTGREKYRQPFAPILADCHFVPFNDAEAMRGVVNAKTAAVLIEVVQGEGGIHVAQPGYLQAIREMCDPC
jgi:putrescine aminotransferase